MEDFDEEKQSSCTSIVKTCLQKDLKKTRRQLGVTTLALPPFGSIYMNIYIHTHRHFDQKSSYKPFDSGELRINV